MNNLVIKRFIPLVLLSITSCVNLYDLKNPNERKQIYIRDIIRAELYLQQTGDTEFSETKTRIKPYKYIIWQYNGRCGENVDSYLRDNMSVEDFVNKVPNIIKNLKGTLFYQEFKDYKPKKERWNPFGSLESMVDFISKEQRNIALINVTNDYICVSFKC